MYLQVSIGGMPVNLILNPKGVLAFVKTQPIVAVFTDDGAAFYSDDFEIAGEGYDYNTWYEYKSIPEMLDWLQRQNLQMPVL